MNFLITGIGGDVGQSVATIVKDRWPRCKIYGTDVHNQHSGSLFVDEFIRLPSARDPEYIDVLNFVLKSKNINIFMPITEPELMVLGSSLNETGQIRCIFPGPSALANCLDKFETFSFMKQIGLDAPWTIKASENLPISYPCILKPRFGSGSRSIFIVNDDKDANFLALRYPGSIFQELLEPEDQEVTCAVYRAHNGEISSLLMLRRLTGGSTGWAQVIEHTDTADICHNIANKLDLRGSINIQLRITDRGPRVFEINPRFSSTVMMRHLLGFSDVVWAVEELSGISISFPKISKGQILLRVQKAVVVTNPLSGV